MPLPTFLVIGAARCGTTTLHNQLAGHPQVAMTAIKEPNHFTFRPDPGGPVPLVAERRIIVKSVAARPAYEKLFRSGPDVLAYGDVSPLYLYVEDSAQLIHDAAPDARIVAVLRDPAERAYSHFLLGYDGPAGEVGAAFAAAVAAEWDAAYTPFTTGTHTLRMGKYWDQLRRYYDRFPAEGIHVLRYADLAADPSATFASLCDFLGIRAEAVRENATVSNASGLPRPGVAGALERGLRRWQPYVKRALPARAVGPLARVRDRSRRSLVTSAPRIDPRLRQRLLEDYYGADLAALEANLGLRLVESTP